MIGHPCARCGTMVADAAIGALCPACTAANELRSKRLARRIALGSALVLAAYVGLRLLPGVRPSLLGAARAVAVAAIVAWWWLSYRIAKEVALACRR